MRKWAAVCALLFVLAMLVPAATTLADDAISVTSNTYKNEFPAQVRFKLEASGSQDITKVSLFYKLRDSAIVTYAYPKFNAGKKVSVEYVWNTQRKYIPPGIEIRYQWIIEDAAGNATKTSPVSFVIDDTRFNWQSVTEDKVSLFWYEGDEAFGRKLVGFAQKALGRIDQDLGIGVEDPVKIYIYASRKDLMGALEPKAQEWTGGRSFSEYSIIALMVEPSNDGINWASRAIPHELTHAVVHQAIRNPYGDIPHWLDEGLAMHSEGVPEASYQRVLDRAVKQNRLISLKALASNFPADPDQATLSYAQSQSVVDYILSRYGRDKMSQLLAVFKEGSTYDDAVQNVLGIDIASLDADWRATLGVAPEPGAVATPAAGRGAPSTTPQICLGIGQILGFMTIGLGLVAKLLSFHMW